MLLLLLLLPLLLSCLVVPLASVSCSRVSLNFCFRLVPLRRKARPVPRQQRLRLRARGKAQSGLEVAPVVEGFASEFRLLRHGRRSACRLVLINSLAQKGGGGEPNKCTFADLRDLCLCNNRQAVSMCMYVYAHMCVCTHVYIYIYLYIVYTYMHIRCQVSGREGKQMCLLFMSFRDRALSASG